MSDDWGDARIITDTGILNINHDEAAVLYAMGLLDEDAAGDWRSNLTHVELLTALEGL